MERDVFDKPSEQTTFLSAEIEELGIFALDKFSIMYGINITSLNICQLKKLYYDIINDHQKYMQFAKWLLPRFERFVNWGISMRIYIGGKKQFIMRGDAALEKSLNAILNAINEYIETGYTTPKRISTLFYYLNLIFK